MAQEAPIPSPHVNCLGSIPGSHLRINQTWASRMAERRWQAPGEAPWPGCDECQVLSLEPGAVVFALGPPLWLAWWLGAGDSLS